MEDANPKKTRTEVLSEIEAAHKLRHAQAERLLNNLKQNKIEIERLLAAFREYEPDFVYRFYHQSFKVFGGNELIRRAIQLFERLSPDSEPLNSWFSSITATALTREFDSSKTNQRWLEETRPILEAFWHSKYFLEQMLVSADELDAAPQMLPSGWAAVLYLYDLR